MSTFQTIYLGMVICTMAVFALTLAWGAWYSRGKGPSTPVVQDNQPKPETRIAA